MIEEELRHRHLIQKPGGYCGPLRFEVWPRIGGIIMRTQGLIASTFAACLLSLMAGSAIADNDSGNLNALLKGTYRYTMMVSCSQSAAFTALPDLQPIGGGGGNTAHTNGFLTYDGLGNVTVDQRGIVIAPGPYSFGEMPVSVGPVVWDKQHCDWKYTVNRDRTFTQGDGNCLGFDKYGPVEFGIPGEQVVVTNMRWEGQIGVGGQMLIFNQQVEPSIETLTTNTGFTTQRVCGYTGTAVRILRK